MLGTTGSIRCAGKRAPRYAPLLLCNLVALGWFSTAEVVSADPAKVTANKAAQPAAAKDSGAPALPSKDVATIKQVLAQTEQLKPLLTAHRYGEALPLSKKTVADIDGFLLSKFSEPNLLAALPSDVVAAMNKKNVDPLCQFIKKEATATGSLQNLANLVSIRTNLKDIIANTPSTPAKSN
jgi:hypothetical protein